MKTTTKSVIGSITLVMVMVTFIYGTSTSGQRHEHLTGYARAAKAGMTFDDYACGALIPHIVVANADDEIAIGTTVWANLAMTVPFPSGIITSLDGSTYGESFWVINGVVDHSTTPIDCQDQLKHQLGCQ